MRVTAETLLPLDERLSSLEPVEVLRHVAAAFGPRAAILSSMQRADTALCHLADRAGLSFDVLFVDTGVLHPETLATRDELVRTHPRLSVRTLAPARSFAEQTRDEGVLYLTKEGQERCCDLRKSEPLASVRGQYDAMIAPIRRDEGGLRSKIRVIEVDDTQGVVRIHPFAALSRAALDTYIGSHADVVVHPLHALGFPSIGCFPCTTPVREDEDERAGRWRHLAGVAYCGINPTDRAERRRSVELSAGCRALFSRLGVEVGGAAGLS